MRPFCEVFSCVVHSQDLLAGVLDEKSAATLFARAHERKVEELLAVGDVRWSRGGIR